MVNLPLAPAGSTAVHRVPQHPGIRYSCCFCCPGYQRQRPWTADRIAHLLSNLFILCGITTALVFAIIAAQQVTTKDVALTVFIVGGTVFGGACLLALVNVAWMSRRPGVRLSAIQVICNVVLFLISSYMELLFWPYPVVAYSILFCATVPMFIMINLPSCFMKKALDQGMDVETVCLDQDAMDDATIVDDVESPNKEHDNSDAIMDDTQETSITVDDVSSSARSSSSEDDDEDDDDDLEKMETIG